MKRRTSNIDPSLTEHVQELETKYVHELEQRLFSLPTCSLETPSPKDQQPPNLGTKRCTNSNCSRPAAVIAHSASSVYSPLVERCDLWDCSRVCKYCWQRFIPEAIKEHEDEDCGRGSSCHKAHQEDIDSNYLARSRAAQASKNATLQLELLNDYQERFPNYAERSEWFQADFQSGNAALQTALMTAPARSAIKKPVHQKQETEPWKKALASIFKENPKMSCLRACQKMDKLLERDLNLAPPEGWQRDSGGERSWQGNCLHSNTKRRVETAFSKIRRSVNSSRF